MWESIEKCGPQSDQQIHIWQPLATPVYRKPSLESDGNRRGRRMKDTGASANVSEENSRKRDRLGFDRRQS